MPSPSGPLWVDGTVIGAGALALGSVDPGAFDEEETALLPQLVGSLSFAVQYMDKQGLTRISIPWPGWRAADCSANERWFLGN